MNTAKKIECPSCGATSVFKLNATEYKCNYCQSTFLLTEEKKARDFLKHTIDQHGKHVTVIRDSKVAKRVFFVFFIAIIVFIAGIGAAIFLSVRNAGSKVTTDPNTVWQTPSLNKYIAFSGSKGPVIWELIEYSGTKLDSSRHELVILDPKTKNVLSDIPFGETTSWKDNFNFHKRLNHEFMLVNDTVYNGSEEGGLQAFGLYIGARIFSNEDFEKRFPQLKDGIAKVESRLYNGQYMITTNAGDEFYYYPAKHILKTKKQEDNAYQTDTATRTNFFLSEGKKPNIYLITQVEGPNLYSVVYNSSIENYERSGKYYHNQIKSLQKVNEMSYPCAQRLVSTKNFVVIAYLSDFSKKPSVIIEKINDTGKSLWQNKDTALTALINNFSGDNLRLKYSQGPTELVLYNSSAINRSIGIDLNTGKTTFVHSQSHKLD